MARIIVLDPDEQNICEPWQQHESDDEIDESNNLNHFSSFYLSVQPSSSVKTPYSGRTTPIVQNNNREQCFLPRIQRAKKNEDFLERLGNYEAPCNDDAEAGSSTPRLHIPRERGEEEEEEEQFKAKGMLAGQNTQNINIFPIRKVLFNASGIRNPRIIHMPIEDQQSKHPAITLPLRKSKKKIRQQQGVQSEIVARNCRVGVSLHLSQTNNAVSYKDQENLNQKLEIYPLTDRPLNSENDKNQTNFISSAMPMPQKLILPHAQIQNPQVITRRNSKRLPLKHFSKMFESKSQKNILEEKISGQNHFGLARFSEHALHSKEAEGILAVALSSDREKRLKSYSRKKQKNQLDTKSKYKSSVQAVKGILHSQEFRREISNLSKSIWNCDTGYLAQSSTTRNKRSSQETPLSASQLPLLSGSRKNLETRTPAHFIEDLVLQQQNNNCSSNSILDAQFQEIFNETTSVRKKKIGQRQVISSESLLSFQALKGTRLREAIKRQKA